MWWPGRRDTKLLKRPYMTILSSTPRIAYTQTLSNFCILLAQNAASPMTPELFKNSTKDIFTTLYAGLADNQLIQQGNSPRTAQGTLSASVTRLFVVSPVAWVIVGILFLIVTDYSTLPKYCPVLSCITV